MNVWKPTIHAAFAVLCQQALAAAFFYCSGLAGSEVVIGATVVAVLGCVVVVLTPVAKLRVMEAALTKRCCRSTCCGGCIARASSMVRQRLPWLVATTNPARSGKAVEGSNSGVELSDVALNATPLA